MIRRLFFASRVPETPAAAGQGWRDYLIDDYAHHPTEIAATIGAARQFHEGRLTVVSNPIAIHGYKILREQFVGPSRV